MAVGTQPGWATDQEPDPPIAADAAVEVAAPDDGEPEPWWLELLPPDDGELWPMRLGTVPPDDAEPLGSVVDETCVEGAALARPGFARVDRTATAGLRVRNGPGAAYTTHLILREGAWVQVMAGPIFDGDGQPWYEIAGDASVKGWSSGDYLTLLGSCAPDAGFEPLGASMVLGRVLSVRVTAYTFQEPGNGAHGWITKSGLPVRWGHVAVDPQVIPLGSQLSIQGFGDTFLAADTGFGVIGHHVDIFFPDFEQCVQFGVQYREVVVLS